MKSLILASLAFFMASATAVNISPEIGNPVCLQRVYKSNDLKKNPLQKLSELTVYLEMIQEDADVYKTAKVVGRSVKNGKLYGNTAWGREGNDYGIDCDGGSFSIVPRSSGTQTWANFVVTPNYYFPLFKGVLQPDIDKMGNGDYDLDLQGDDQDNNVWRLEEVPAAVCEEKLSQISANEGGC